MNIPDFKVFNYVCCMFLNVLPECVNVCIMWVLHASRRSEEGLGIPELELQTVVSCRIDAGNKA